MSNSSNKTIAKNTAFLYVRMLVVMVVTFYTSRVILQVLGVSDYGIYNVVGGVVTMMSFINGALGASSSRFLTYALGKGDKEELNKTFSASLNLHICVALLVFLVGETLGLWFLYEKMVIPEERMIAAFWVFQFSIFTTMVSFTLVPYNATLIAHENMSVYAYVGLYEAFAKLGIVYLITISPIDNLIFYALLLMLNACAIQIFYRCYTLKHYSECRFRIIKDKKLYKTLLNYSGWELFGGVAVVSQGQGINILLNLFFGPVVNAARAIAVQIQTAVVLFVNNFLTAVRPQVIKSMADNNPYKMYNLTFYAAKFGYFLMLAIVLPLCFEMDFVLRIWLGDNVPQYTNIFAIIVLITYLMETYHFASLMAYHAIGKIKTGNMVGGSLMISALPISYILLRLGLPEYVPFLVIFCVNFIQMFFTWWLLHEYERFSYWDLIRKVYIPTISVTILSVIVPIFVKCSLTAGWGRFFVLLLSSESIILTLIFFIGLNNEERQKLFVFINQKLSRKI